MLTFVRQCCCWERPACLPACPPLASFLVLRCSALPVAPVPLGNAIQSRLLGLGGVSALTPKFPRTVVPHPSVHLIVACLSLSPAHTWMPCFSDLRKVCLVASSASLLA